ncbi:MAG TPA: tetratricopeptide repeat protein [Casimicrobiaceae bacterium]|nr:tetratricopeptide repeat protein [Casimicrobiaceae bacterium]
MSAANSKPPPGTALRRALGLLQAGRLAEAERSCCTLLVARPDDFHALHLLGVIRARQEAFDEADRLLSRARAIDPQSAEACSNHGNVQRALGRSADALASFDRALVIRPRYVDALNNRGGALRDLQRFDEAIESFDRALAISPNFAVAHYNRGAALSALKRHEEALASYDRALALERNFAEALNNRGGALAALARHEEALASYDRALALRPAYAEALQNRGAALAHFGRYESAAEVLARALELNPDLPFARGTLLHARMHCCDWRTWEDDTKQVLADVRAGRLACEPFMFLAVSDSPGDQLRCSETWLREHCPPVAGAAWSGTRYRHERIRLAYVSSDFGAHPASYLMAGLFEQHDRQRFETIAISLGADDGSAIAARTRKAFDRFIDARALSDRDIVGLMRGLEIDIAVDRNGYTSNARPRIFAQRPAPIQVNYLGYPGTTAAPYMDYLIADETIVPREEQGFYAERIAYLPDTYWVNDSGRRIAEATPSRAEAGLPDRGFVFCCFNNPYKINPPLFDLWMRLLGQVEGSVLWLLKPNPIGERNLRGEAAKRGVDPSRLVFAPRMPPEEHLARHRLADLFVDTLPYNAHTTACDALWAGLPVLTCIGTSFPGRVASSVLRAVGLPQSITGSLAQYESEALALARDPDRLRELRQALARNRTTTPLFDTDRFRRHIEAAYTAMWERHQRGEPPASFAVSELR